jgi:hypothetical protein
MDRERQGPSKRAREPAHPHHLGPILLAFQSLGHPDHDGMGVHLPRGARHHLRSLPDRRDGQCVKRRRDRPAGITHGEPEPAEAEIHA